MKTWIIFYAVCLFLCGHSASPHGQSTVNADIRIFARTERNATSKRYQGYQAGGGGIVSADDITLRHATVTESGTDIVVTASHNGIESGQLDSFTDFPRQTYIEGTCSALALPPDWKGMDRLTMTASCGDKPLTVELTVVGARGRLTDSRKLSAGETTIFNVALIDLPLIQGTRNSFEPTGIRIACYWQGSHEPRSFTVHTVSLVQADALSPRACIDRWGQRISASWPLKVTSDDDLALHLEAEKECLTAIDAIPDRNAYGGWTGGPRFDSTGFFRLECDSNSRWWYVDPEGCPFWSIGTTGVRLTDDTPIDGRETIFADIPVPRSRDAEKLGAYNDNGHIRFYRMNVLRKYGSPEAWRDHVLWRFRKWGYTTIANWSQAIMLDQKKIPHVRTLGTRQPESCRINRAFYDVWDPRWEAAFDSLCAADAATQKGNQWLIGYFIDNEKPWHNMRLLDAGPDAPLRDAWLAFIRERFQTPEAFCRATGTDASVTSWNHIRLLKTLHIADNIRMQALLAEFGVIYAQKYFSTIRRILKKHDPNHLYLGCRFTKRLPPDGIVKAAGKYCDVISINSYSLVPERDRFRKWHELSGRPIQVGEHHLPQYGPRQAPPLYPAFTPDERRTWAETYDRTLASMPFVIGSHWFQHADQPLSGRGLDGENQIIGIVDITDQPHEELVEAIRTVTSHMYQWHMDAK